MSLTEQITENRSVSSTPGLATIQDRATHELSKIVELFQNGESQRLEAIVTKALIDAPEKPSSKWSLGNQILMLLEGTEDARGFHQWKEVKRYVKQGSKAFYILGPLTVKHPKEENKDEFEYKIIGFHAIPVFRIEETDGEALPIFKPRTIPPLVQVAERWNLKIQYEKHIGGYGAFNPENKTIYLATEDIGTFFHELTHAAQLRLDGAIKNGQDPEQEAIAQLSSAVLCRVFGYNQDAYTWNYIAHYAKERSVKAVGTSCLRILSRVQKILNLILEEA